MFGSDSPGGVLPVLITSPDGYSGANFSLRYKY